MGHPITRRSFVKAALGTGAGLATGVTVTSASTSTDRFIVDKEESDGVSTSDVRTMSIVHDMLDEIGLAVVRASEDELEGMEAVKDIEYEVDFPKPRGLLPWEPDDEKFRLQWDKQAQDIPLTHQFTKGEGTRVAVIDSGIWDGHPDLQEPLNVELSQNFTGDGKDHNPTTSTHGTHVGGIVAAASNDKGVVGHAPETELVDCRVFSKERTSFGDVLAAMTYAGKIECDAANMSLGAYPLPKGNKQVQKLKAAFERAAKYAAKQGTLMIAAAGNDGTNLDTDGKKISLPNEAEGIMSIGATGPVGYRWDDSEQFPDWYRFALNNLEKPTHAPAFYTNYGEKALDVSAPGGNLDQEVLKKPPKKRPDNYYYDLVLNTVYRETEDGKKPAYSWLTGTSMAAPQVTGLAALIKSRNPDASPSAVRNHIEETADEYSPKKYYGNGQISTFDAVLFPVWATKDRNSVAGHSAADD